MATRPPAVQQLHDYLVETGLTLDDVLGFTTAEVEELLRDEMGLKVSARTVIKKYLAAQPPGGPAQHAPLKAPEPAAGEAAAGSVPCSSAGSTVSAVNASSKAVLDLMATYLASLSEGTPADQAQNLQAMQTALVAPEARHSGPTLPLVDTPRSPLDTPRVKLFGTPEHDGSSGSASDKAASFTAGRLADGLARRKASRRASATDEEAEAEQPGLSGEAAAGIALEEDKARVWLSKQSEIAGRALRRREAKLRGDLQAGEAPPEAPATPAAFVSSFACPRREPDGDSRTDVDDAPGLAADGGGGFGSEHSQEIFHRSVTDATQQPHPHEPQGHGTDALPCFESPVAWNDDSMLPPLSGRRKQATPDYAAPTKSSCSKTARRPRAPLAGEPVQLNFDELASKSGSRTHRPPSARTHSSHHPHHDFAAPTASYLQRTAPAVTPTNPSSKKRSTSVTRPHFSVPPPAASTPTSGARGRSRGRAAHHQHATPCSGRMPSAGGRSGSLARRGKKRARTPCGTSSMAAMQRVFDRNAANDRADELEREPKPDMTVANSMAVPPPALNEISGQAADQWRGGGFASRRDARKATALASSAQRCRSLPAQPRGPGADQSLPSEPWVVSCGFAFKRTRVVTHTQTITQRVTGTRAAFEQAGYATGDFDPPPFPQRECPRPPPTPKKVKLPLCIENAPNRDAGGAKSVFDTVTGIQHLTDGNCAEYGEALLARGLVSDTEGTDDEAVAELEKAGENDTDARTLEESEDASVPEPRDAAPEAAKPTPWQQRRETAGVYEQVGLAVVAEDSEADVPDCKRPRCDEGSPPCSGHSVSNSPRTTSPVTLPNAAFPANDAPGGSPRGSAHSSPRPSLLQTIKSCSSAASAPASGLDMAILSGDVANVLQFLAGDRGFSGDVEEGLYSGLSPRRI
ncbi:hypothetical protein DIPPA_35444 [Diplonema papillatum]|nr:hypothetical protein DIPPA_35444 [Diplonema papillatum]|eukprot:gene7870-12091_t